MGGSGGRYRIAPFVVAGLLASWGLTFLHVSAWEEVQGFHRRVTALGQDASSAQDAVDAALKELARTPPEASPADTAFLRLVEASVYAERSARIPRAPEDPGWPGWMLPDALVGEPSGGWELVESLLWLWFLILFLPMLIGPTETAPGRNAWAFALLLGWAVVPVIAPIGVRATAFQDFIVEYGPPVEASTTGWLSHLAPPLSAALIGFYLFALLSLHLASRRGTLERTYARLVARGIAVIVLSFFWESLALGALSQALAFVTGVFPESGLRALASIAKQTFEKAGAKPEKAPSVLPDLQALASLPGLDPVKAGILADHGIETPGDLASRTLAALLKEVPERAIGGKILTRAWETAHLWEEVGEETARKLDPLFGIATARNVVEYFDAWTKDKQEAEQRTANARSDRLAAAVPGRDWDGIVAALRAELATLDPLPCRDDLLPALETILPTADSGDELIARREQLLRQTAEVAALLKVLGAADTKQLREQLGLCTAGAVLRFREQQAAAREAYPVEVPENRLATLLPAIAWDLVAEKLRERRRDSGVETEAADLP